MAIDYTLNWSNDSLKPPFTLVGGTVDTTTTSLALTGRGYVNWGERVQENFLRLLENFASDSPPPNPTIGQLWYNSALDQLNLWSSSSIWVVVGCGGAGGSNILDTSGNSILDTSGDAIISV